MTSRASAVVALVLTGAGAVLFTDGPVGLGRLAKLLCERAGLILLVLAGMALVTNVAPRGTAVGPLAVAVAGSGFLLWDRLPVWQVAGAGVVAVGGWLAMLGRQTSWTDRLDPVARRTAVLFRREVTIGQGDEAPAQLFACAVGAKLIIDLRAARPPRQAVLEIFVTCLLGRVEIHIADTWPVVPGRLHTTWGIHFTGRLDSLDPSLFPNEPKELARLKALVEQRKKPGSNSRSVPVVVHVTGVGGAVSLEGR